MHLWCAFIVDYEEATIWFSWREGGGFVNLARIICLKVTGSCNHWGLKEKSSSSILKIRCLFQLYQAYSRLSNWFSFVMIHWYFMFSILQYITLWIQYLLFKEKKVKHVVQGHNCNLNLYTETSWHNSYKYQMFYLWMPEHLPDILIERKVGQTCIFRSRLQIIFIQMYLYIKECRRVLNQAIHLKYQCFMHTLNTWNYDGQKDDWTKFVILHHVQRGLKKK